MNPCCKQCQWSILAFVRELVEMSLFLVEHAEVSGHPRRGDQRETSHRVLPNTFRWLCCLGWMLFPVRKLKGSAGWTQSGWWWPVSCRTLHACIKESSLQCRMQSRGPAWWAQDSIYCCVSLALLFNLQLMVGPDFGFKCQVIHHRGRAHEWDRVACEWGGGTFVVGVYSCLEMKCKEWSKRFCCAIHVRKAYIPKVISYFAADTRWNFRKIYRSCPQSDV